MKRFAVLLLPCLAALSTSCGDDGASPPDDAGTTRDAATRDAATPRDAGPDDDAAADLDGGSIPHDATARDAGPARQDGGNTAELTGIWEGAWMEDSGGPRETVPPGTFLVFETGGTLRFNCTGSPLPYTTDGTVIDVDLGGSLVTWTIVELTATTFAFGEGGDVFGYERRTSCP